MILSTKVSLRFANAHWRQDLDSFVEEYTRVTKLFVDILWEMKKFPSKLPKPITSQITDSWLTARALQCSGKQAAGIVKGTRKKHEQRIWKLKQLQRQKQNTSKLQRVIDRTKMTKPELKRVCPELDSRFVTIEWGSATSFDGWLKLNCLGRKMEIHLPIKKTKHFLEMESRGILKSGCRISHSWVAFNFEIPDPEPIAKGSTIGIDIGLLDCWTSSDGQKSQRDKDNWNLEQINYRLARRKKGSKGFARAQAHRTNYVNWSLNRLNLDNVQQINIENIKHIRKGKRVSRKLSSWTYTEIFDKLDSLGATSGVQVNRVNPAFTSQRCSECGWTRRVNRDGKAFRCRACGFTADADWNASRNIALGLPTPWAERRDRKNIQGFFWEPERCSAAKEPPGQEKKSITLVLAHDIVPDVQRTSCNVC